MRTFDAKQQFDAIKSSAVSAVKEIFPVEGRLRTIRLESVWVEDSLAADDYKAQQTARTGEQTWGAPVFASLVLEEKSTGKVLDKMARVRLFQLPKMTSRYSYIVGGNEYQVTNQLRLKSGVYTLRKQNGELKTQVNLARGKNFDLTFDEKKGLFFIAKVGGGQANIPLYPVLAYLGMSAPAIAQAWGEGLEQANRSSSPAAIAKASSAFGVRKGDLKSYFQETQLGGDTTKMVLGEAFTKVDGPMLLASSKHLLHVHTKKQQPTDRDSLVFKELHSTEDFISERIQKNKNALNFKLRRNIDNPRRTRLSQIVNPGTFNAVVESFFTQDDKSATPEQTNPLEMISGHFAVTTMRTGGITSEHAVRPETREIHATHYGFIDPVSTPESSKVGVNMHLPLGTVKDGKDVRAVVFDKKGKPVTLTPLEMFNAYVAVPAPAGGTTYKVYYRGQMMEVPAEKVQYFTPSSTGLFSWSTNLIPFLGSNQGNRAMMASKQLEQAISLKHREAPLVQVAGRLASGHATIEQRLGSDLAVHAKEAGVVTALTGDSVVVRGAGGETYYSLYDNFSLNRKSFMHHTPLVKVGDKVAQGQLLADSNFTKGGELALGTNMRVAYLPYKGLTFEDGIVISESAATKLTSEHIHKKTVDLAVGSSIMGLTTFRSFYPNAISPASLAKLDTDGVVKVGQRLRQGDAVIALLEKRAPSAAVGMVSRSLADRPKDATEYWSLEDEGIVIDVQRTPSRIVVSVKTEEKAKIGDKLAGRYGNKGIITKILPDKETPHDKDGKPVDVMLNPHGVVSRINIGQIYEAALSKVALKKGQVQKVQNFSGENYLDSTKKALAGAKLQDKEELFDPVTKQSLGQVNVGNPYILKLSKQGTVNFSVRQGGAGSGYDANGQPLKAGGDESAKKMDMLTIYSMLAHGARANLHEMTSIKSNQNDEFWTALKAGQTLPPPQAPFVYNKFMGFLRGAGIDVQKKGTELTLAPLTDAEIRRQSAGAIQKPVFFRGKDMDPLKGGFYDPAMTGGFRGNKWTHIELTEPVLNPVFSKAVAKITGLGTKLGEVVEGRMHVDPATGQLNTDGKGLTGGAGVEHILKGINLDQAEAETLAKIKTAKGVKLDDLNKKLRYVTALKQNNMRPEEAYIRRVMPVLPPAFRPTYTLPDGSVTSSDINYIYQNMGIINTMMKQPVMSLLAEEEKAAVRTDLARHMEGVTGLTDLNIKGKPRKGFISEIKGGEGGSPKEGFFISKMLSKKQDFVGRGVIIPEPDLGLDEMGMPEEMAWKLFEPFVTAELRKFSKTPLEAKAEIKARSSMAKQALTSVMAERHVLLNRAPSLHKFSIMAFKPTITAGRSLKIPPLVCKGFGADFDGDAMSVHVPITHEANIEAMKLRPSQNLFKPGTGSLMVEPSQEAQIGIYYLSQTEEGRKKLNAIVGPQHQITGVLDKKKAGELFNSLARDLPGGDFARIVQAMKLAGENHTYQSGFTLSLSDLVSINKQRDIIVQDAERKVNRLKSGGKLRSGTEAQVDVISSEASKLMDMALDKKLSGQKNSFHDMVTSGARGNKTQLRSILASPLFVTDASGRTIGTAIKNSYAEGLDIGDYWVSMYGARKGAMDRSLQTSLPGAFSKDVMATVVDNVVSAADCGTHEGISLAVDDRDALDRFLAGDQMGFAHNTLVSHAVQNQLKAKGAKTALVRSVLKCHRAKGVCSKCHGLDEHGNAPAVGDNVGAKAGQTISEPLVQMIMTTRHTGGVAGGARRLSADIKGLISF